MSAVIDEYPLERLEELLPRPAADANKYTRGKLSIVGGCQEYPGSVCLASAAASRTGAGYVEVFCDVHTQPIVQTRTPSVVARDWTLLFNDHTALSRSQALDVGSGMTGQSSFEHALVMDILQSVPQPVLIDGGAITVLATEQGRQAALTRVEQGAHLIVTPHFGEAERLAKGAAIAVPTAMDAEGLSAFATELSRAYGACVVLKGPDTYISSDADDALYSMRLGTPALAKAGTGDVLAGMIGSLLAQGLASVDAACIGATLHAEAGRAAATELGEISVMAEDVAAAIPRAIQQFA